MGIAIIVLLAVIVILLLWDRIQRSRVIEKQGDTLSKAVGESATLLFGDVQRSLGELDQRTREIHEVGRNISGLQELLSAPKPRGGLGELLLERLLADTLPRDHYTMQHSFSNGKTVDAVIRLSGYLVPIDSKFPLEDFERMIAAETEEEQRSLRRRFSRTIKGHIDNVSQYILPDEDTFDFAFMYIPAENIYYEAILRDESYTGGNDLCSYFLKKRVIPVSPNSFYAYLQAIVLGLKGLQIEKRAGQISGHLERLKHDLDDFQRDYGILGRHISEARQKYETAGSKLNRFSDRLQLAGETAAERPEGEEGSFDH